MKCYRVSVLRSIEVKMEVWAMCEDDAIDAALGYDNGCLIAEEDEFPCKERILESYLCERISQC